MVGRVRERERERTHATSLTAAAAARLNSGVCLWTVWTACALLTRANSGQTARAIQFAADTRSHRLCVVRARASFPHRSFVSFRIAYEKFAFFAFGHRCHWLCPVPVSGYSSATWLRIKKIYIYTRIERDNHHEK